MTEPSSNAPATPRLDFIREIIAEDLASGKHPTTITRFPPEPNGYLHIGHAKAICLNFGIQREQAATGARCHLRFDDTNPAKEEEEYVRSIQEDIRWLGFDWGDGLYFASDYFETMYQCAVHLIKEDKAYVDSQSAEEIRMSRGTLTEPGRESPFRHRPVDESLDLFERMKSGEFDDGAHVLRAKIDMGASNLNLRDPVIYRILHAHHHRTGDKWFVYPMYDFAHPIEDALEHITHSLCSLEFEDHRPLYDWVVTNCPLPSKPRQIEFARLNLSYTIMSKRKLLQLVKEGHVNGWDDPRMPTLSGLRRRGYTPASLRHFCATIGMTKKNSTTDVALLEHSIREDLNKIAPRYMGVLRPLRVLIENLPSDHCENLEAALNPEGPDAGTRMIPFGPEFFIEHDDFMEDPPKKFFRLGPGREVRLRHAYTFTCTGFEKDPESGEITLLRGTIDKDTLGKNPEGRKVSGVIHWVSAREAIPTEIRLYDRLFVTPDPDAAEEGFLSQINPDSLETLASVMEPAALELAPESRIQFERVGYFVTDIKDHVPGKTPVFNRIVALKDSWAKISGQ